MKENILYNFISECSALMWNDGEVRKIWWTTWLFLLSLLTACRRSSVEPSYEHRSTTVHADISFVVRHATIMHYCTLLSSSHPLNITQDIILKTLWQSFFVRSYSRGKFLLYNMLPYYTVVQQLRWRWSSIIHVYYRSNCTM